MRLFGLQIRPVSGPEIVNFGDLSGPEPLQNPVQNGEELRAPPF